MSNYKAIATMAVAFALLGKGKNQVKYPNIKITIDLNGESGNAFYILGRCVEKLRLSSQLVGLPSKQEVDKEVATFTAAATKSDYANLLKVCREWFDFKTNLDSAEEN